MTREERTAGVHIVHNGVEAIRNDHWHSSF